MRVFAKTVHLYHCCYDTVIERHLLTAGVLLICLTLG